MDDVDSIGFLRYEGKLVEGGLLEAKSAARALNGFDSSLRYFISVQRPALAEIDLPIPVKIEEGSWEAHIPTTILGWISSAAAIGGAAYLAKAAQKLAENDFKEVGLKDIIKGAIKSVQWLVRTGLHLGHLEVKRITEGLKWDQEFVGIPNAKGELLQVPISEIKKLAACPTHLLADIASVIELERSLVIGVNENGKIETVRIDEKKRHIFYTPSDDSEVLFPELIHGMNVELDGLVTRGNGRANTIGFLYQKHVLTCEPEQGNIIRFKKHLFLECKIIGMVSRDDAKGHPKESRPRIIFRDLIIISDQEQSELPLGSDDDEGE
jgi:hypothetical protein